MESDCGTFYGVQSLAMMVTWSIFSLLERRDWHRRAEAVAVAWRPSWMPWVALSVLLQPRVYKLLCHCTPILFGIAAFIPDSTWMRVFVAVFMSLYNLAESSRTHSHRDFPSMYISWSLALMPAR